MVAAVDNWDEELKQGHTVFDRACESTGVRDDDRAAWLQARTSLLTATDIVALFGYDKHRDAVKVYADKVAPNTEPEEKLGLDDPRFWGSHLEQPILHAVATHYGWTYNRGGYLLRSLSHPQLGCTLDAEIYRADDEGWVTYEGKTTRFPSDYTQLADSDDIPDKVLLQVQAQLLVTGAPASCVFALLQGCVPFIRTVYPSDALHTAILEESEWFWELVQRQQVPEVTHRSGPALQQLWPKDNGNSIGLPAESVDWTVELMALSEQAKGIEKRMDHLKSELKRSMGEAMCGTLPEPVNGKSRWKWSAPSHQKTRRLVAMK